MLDSSNPAISKLDEKEVTERTHEKKSNIKNKYFTVQLTFSLKR
jgi:hypothetical protein